MTLLERLLDKKKVLGITAGVLTVATILLVAWRTVKSEWGSEALASEVRAAEFAKQMPRTVGQPKTPAVRASGVSTHKRTPATPAQQPGRQGALSAESTMQVEGQGVYQNSRERMAGRYQGISAGIRHVWELNIDHTYLHRWTPEDQSVGNVEEGRFEIHDDVMTLTAYPGGPLPTNHDRQNTPDGVSRDSHELVFRLDGDDLFLDGIRLTSADHTP